MFNLSLGELLLYLLFGVIICGIFAAIVFFIAKKDGAKLEDLLAGVPEDKLELLKAEEYQPMDGNGIKCATRGLIAAIDSDDKKAKIHLLFFNSPRQEFYDQTAKISAAEAKGKGFKQFDMVPCEMKYDKEMHIHEFKKLM